MTRTQLRLTAACALGGTIVYFLLALLDPVLFPETRTTAEFLSQMATPKYARLNVLVHFVMAGVAILWATGFIGLRGLLSDNKRKLALRLGEAAGFAMAAIFVCAMIVQSALMVEGGKTFAAAHTPATQENAVALYRALRTIDMALDLGFDTFLFTAWICFALAFLTDARFGKLVGGVGLALFFIDIPIQIWSAPRPPTFDIGPIAAVWMLWVYVLAWRAAKASGPPFGAG